MTSLRRVITRPVSCGPSPWRVTSKIGGAGSCTSIDSDREAAKASLVAASSILKSEIERSSGANGSRPGALAGWQIARVRAFIEENLHRNIDTMDLSAVAQRSPAHFSRSFKKAIGEPPHAY